MSSAPALKGPAPKPGRYVKISIFLRKLPHITDEYFHAYWANNHIIPALANKLFVEKVRRYNQHHITPELREQIQATGVPALDYDGVAEVWVDSLEDWKAISQDKDFIKAILPDEDHFLLKPNTFQIGYDNLVIGDEWQPKVA
ncbi:uncharacterized protein E0L32_010338 [Thyridium curvatum]|uniref:EthD domain-containing protein n=1 Tax=Thyridium curvatum TaxID=1093900 RepID=A0A507ALJ6_9PEZI|nr:uncharacterized protein E0L32_010338 [Thyridium curvatum]TPX08007.1 hypothetical protein E0L32_010338 [Thyridium curvatum]